MARKILQLCTMLLIMGGLAFATCQNSTNSIASFPAAGTRAAAQYTLTAGCTATFTHIHVSMANMSASQDTAAQLVVHNGLCGSWNSGNVVLIAWLNVTGTVGSTDRFDLVQPLDSLAPQGGYLCAEFSVSNPGIAQAISYQFAQQ